MLVERAAETGRNPATKKGHSPAAVEALAKLTKVRLPQPDYAKAGPAKIDPSRAGVLAAKGSAKNRGRT